MLRELVKLPEVQSSGSKIAVCDAEKLSEISLQFKVKLIEFHKIQVEFITPIKAKVTPIKLDYNVTYFGQAESIN